jgi:hypothetical protein
MTTEWQRLSPERSRNHAALDPNIVLGFHITTPTLNWLLVLKRRWVLSFDGYAHLLSLRIPGPYQKRLIHPVFSKMAFRSSALKSSAKQVLIASATLMPTGRGDRGDRVAIVL